MRISFISGTIAALLLAGSAVAQTPGDAEKGKAVFIQCKTCHSLDAGKNMIGPSLHGLFGRMSGSVEGYNYSAAMKNAEVTWSEETLRKYLPDPKAFVPGDKMTFVGVKDPAKLNDLIAYLKQATQ